MEAHKMRHFEIHRETEMNRLIGKGVFIFWHAVVVGTEPDDNGNLHPVCNGNVIVDPESWKRQLRDWFNLPDGLRCPDCRDQADDEIKIEAPN